MRIIKRRRMIHAAIIPNRDIVRVLPPIPHLQVMVLRNELHKPLEQVPALVLGKIVDLLHVVPDGEDALPSGYGVCAHDRVDCFEDFADVFGRAAGAWVDREVVLVCDLVEAGLGVCGG
jgi:hypothetical protein